MEYQELVKKDIAVKAQLRAVKMNYELQRNADKNQHEEIIKNLKDKISEEDVRYRNLIREKQVAYMARRESLIVEIDQIETEMSELKRMSEDA